MMAKLGKRQVRILQVLRQRSPLEYTAVAAKCDMCDEWGPMVSFDNAVAGLERMEYAQVDKPRPGIAYWTIEITDAGRAALAEQEAGTDG